MNFTSERIADLLVHLARRSVQCSASELTSAQWAALRFFAHANRFSRQPSAFASYHGTTRGTASQTVKSLVHLGYLERSRGVDDRRSAVFDVTSAGMEALNVDPLNRLVKTLDELPQDKRETLGDALITLNEESREADAKTGFGCCSNCRHFERCGLNSGFCNHSAVALDVDEIGRLCWQFSSI